MSTEIKKIDFANEMQTSYLDYAMSVIMSRALPDVRDGLKPVHRRILYTMIMSDYHYDKPYRKSARVVGEVLGKYHPHSDDAIYESIVKMAQDFHMNLVLVDGQGNFGSIDGDKAAASRYTEVRLTKAAHYMLDECFMDTVDYIPNYDNTATIAEVLPARFPNLLINGSSGIAVGMATNIPSHNLKEVMKACILLLRNPQSTIDDIMQYIKGPDFNSTCSILVDDSLKHAYEAGKGSFQIRARHTIEKIDDKEAIIFHSIPYQINKTNIIEHILSLMKDKTLDSISEIRDESDRTGVRLIVLLKKGTNPNIVVNQIYSFTQLQTVFHINALVIDKLQPMQVSIKDILISFIEFRRSVVIRRTKYLLNKHKKKLSSLKAMLVAVHNIDTIIPLLKDSGDVSIARSKLIERSWKNNYKLSEEQVNIILDMRLNKLTNLESHKIENDLHEVEQLIIMHENILSNDSLLVDVIQKEFEEIIELFGKDRTTVICSNTKTNIEQLIEREDLVITLSMQGYIKRVPLSEYKIQNRGGKGRSAMNTKESDSVSKVFFANTHTPVLFFTSSGRVFTLKAYDIPAGSITTRGNFIRNILPLETDEVLSTILIVPENHSEWQNIYIVFATSSGTVRKNALCDFENIRSNGKLAIKLDDNTTLVAVALCKDNDDIILTSSTGLCTRFSSSELRTFISRTSSGVIGMRLAANDKLVSMMIVNNTEHQILTVSKNGLGKRSNLINAKHRGCKGQKIMQINKKTGPLVSSILVTPEDHIIILTHNGNIIRCKVEDIRFIAGLNTQGVKLVTLNQADGIISVDKIASSQLI